MWWEGWRDRRGSCDGRGGRTEGDLACGGRGGRTERDLTCGGRGDRIEGILPVVEGLEG